MSRPTFAGAWWLFVTILAVVLCLSCGGPAPVSPTSTPDYAALESQVAVKLGATLTAKAPPTETFTPSPTPVPLTPTHRATRRPSPTATSEPAYVGLDASLACARITQGGAANIVLSDLTHEQEQMLTHFVEPLNLCDVAWSRDGEWLVFVSAHDYMYSHRNERNVFIMRADGSGLCMVTGEHLSPEVAPGPYGTLRGRVVGAECACLVSAQGAASVVATGEGGAFELPGVPISAKWARAVCQDDESALQGDVELASSDGGLVPITISVKAEGRGWLQASLSRDGRVVAGTCYHWTLDPEGKRHYQVEGVLSGVDGTPIGRLEMPPETSLLGVDWSPVADHLVGALTGEENAWLCFGLRRWLWWEKDKHKTDLMLVSAEGGDLRTLVESEWGAAANHASWTGDGQSIYYHVTEDPPHDDYCSETGGDIWVVAASGGPPPVRWTEDGVSYLPAVGPGSDSTPR